RNQDPADRRAQFFVDGDVHFLAQLPKNAIKAIGIPTNMFTCIFALSRTVGWISHWHEMMSDPKQKIGRPRQLYTGHSQRKYTPIK
ncbi:MAG: citrate/2-methylcitrate synthase, partial [Pseudomonadota bacterium]|nr:citrate/2-methylcitrate synthase [Pseudomonadota bacterium]